MLTKLFSLSFIAGSLSIVAVACGGTTDEKNASSNQADSVDDSAFTACQSDADCVAVPVAGCCDNGWRAAIASSKADAYAAAHACTEQVMCPAYKVSDTRVAECNNTSHACEMVAIADIKCKGFIRNAHQCPDGYDCQLPIQYGGDVPGSCVAHVDPTPAVCGGIAGLQCPAGQTCNYDDPNCDPSNGGADCSGHCK